MEERYSPQSYQPQQYIDSKPMTMWSWLGTILLLGIPIVNIVLLFVWSFSSGVNESKKNFSRAYLIVSLIATVLFSIYFMKVMSDLANAMANFPG